MNVIEHLELISRVKYFYLAKIGEPRENDLQIIIEEASASLNPARDKLVESLGIKGSVFPIESGPDSLTFKITWQHYVSYCVTNESYAKGEAKEKRRKKH